MLSEKDIAPGRHYLCRVSNAIGDRLAVLRAGRALSGGAGRSFFAVGVAFGLVRDGVEVLRELDLEALAAEVETAKAFSWDDVTEETFGVYTQPMKVGVTLTHQPTGAVATVCKHYLYRENREASRSIIVRKMRERGMSAPTALPDESALVDEITEGVERALGG